MFIVTTEPPPILSQLEVQLSLPEGHDITLKASVVHVIDAAQAERDQARPGIGVQFIELDRTQKQQIQQLIEYARWEGVSDKPSASYASRMFELSAAKPAQMPPSVAQQPPAMPSLPAREAATTPSVPAAARSKAPAGKSSGTPEQPAPAGKPTDTAKLKLGMTHLAHKRFDQAIKTFEEVVAESPTDRAAQQWVHVPYARRYLKQDKEERALESYQKVLAIDETNGEARKWVRDYSEKKRLNALPFGRYFVKKP